MLRLVSSLTGYAIEESDSHVGSVSGVLFDDATWRVRRLMISHTRPDSLGMRSLRAYRCLLPACQMTGSARQDARRGECSERYGVGCRFQSAVLAPITGSAAGVSAGCHDARLKEPISSGSPVNSTVPPATSPT